MASGRTETITLEQLRKLTAIMADDHALWDPRTVTEAYIVQGLRYLTLAIDGSWSFEVAADAMKEMQP